MDDDELDLKDVELFDVSDIDYKWGKTRSRKEVTLIMKTNGAEFSLMKTYLALKNYVDQIEIQLGVLDSSPDNH